MVKQDRSLGLLILLSILTCGIYDIIFWYKLSEDMNIMCQGDDDETTTGAAFVLLFLFTCGIFPFIWFYKVGNRLQANSRRYGMDFPESGSTVLLWMILGSFIAIGPLIAAYIVIKNSNMIAAKYNRSNGNGGFGGNGFDGGQNFGGYGGGNGFDGGNNGFGGGNGFDGGNNGFDGGQNYLGDGGQGFDGGQNFGGNGFDGGQNFGGNAFGGGQNFGGNAFGGGQNFGGNGFGGGQQDYAATQALSQSISLSKDTVAPPGVGAVLKCGSGEFEGSSFPLRANDRLVIGRELDCQIKFAATTPNVSRRHCIVEYDGNTVWVTDNNSSFGTFLANGVRLESMRRTAINPGMGFYLGNRNILFYL